MKFDRRRFLATLGAAAGGAAASRLVGDGWLPEFVAPRVARAAGASPFRGFVLCYGMQHLCAHQMRFVPKGEDREKFNLDRYNFRETGKLPETGGGYVVDLKDSGLDWPEPIRAIVDAPFNVPAEYITIIDGLANSAMHIERDKFGTSATSHAWSQASVLTGGPALNSLGTPSYPDVAWRIHEHLARQQGNSYQLLGFDTGYNRGTHQAENFFGQPSAAFDPNDGSQTLSNRLELGLQRPSRIWDDVFRDRSYPDGSAPKVDPLKQARPQTVRAVIERYKRLLGRVKIQYDQDRLAQQIARLEQLYQDTQLPAPISQQCSKPTQPPAPTEGTYVQELMAVGKMIAMAFACDISRVAGVHFRMPNAGVLENLKDYVFRFADGTSETVRGDVHNIHAHASSASRREDHTDAEWNEAHRVMRLYNRSHCEYVAAIASELHRTSDPLSGKSLLDNTLIVLTAELSDGAHEVNDRMMVLVGKMPGLNTGKYYRFPAVNPMRVDNIIRNYLHYAPYQDIAQFYITLMQAYGMTIDRIGPTEYKGDGKLANRSGTLKELIA
ncbi:MAG: hypothetical protein H6707_10300 [Deltaproteobacteria bacterium]|nr:hypothetical protein [Deltaproteobacteria bacterium]